MQSGYAGESDPKYKCCCNCMHVRVGAIVIGVLELLGAVSNIGVSFKTFGEGGHHKVPGEPYYQLVGAVILIIAVVVMFIGIKKENPTLLIPHMVVQVVGIISLAILGIVLICFLALGTTAVNQHENIDEASAQATIIAFIFIVIALFVSALIEIWFFVVILKLYRYYQEKRAASYIPAVQYNQQKP